MADLAQTEIEDRSALSAGYQSPEDVSETSDASMSLHADAARAQAGDVRKTYYSISEVCSKTNLEPHVLRYWESEFSQLRPKKNRAGNRAYREKDIEIIQYIKHLLYVEQYTIPGAKKKLAVMRDASDVVQTELPLPPPAPAQPPPRAVRGDIHGIVTELRDLLRLVRS